MAEQDLQLDDGSRVGVIGGGPAGSLFSFFLLDFAERMGIDIQVDIYEPRDYTRPGPVGCNMCGGIISESLVQNLASEGITLPPTIVQRGIDSYMLHMDVGSVRIDTPIQEKRIGAVYRGPGPRDIKEIKWGSFDGFLQGLAMDKGANVIRDRVAAITMDDGSPQLKTRKGEPQRYDLLTIAVGVNSAARKLFDDLNFEYEPPKTTKTFIQEYYMGEEAIVDVLGSSMHVFLLDIPRLEFAAVIPKGDYVSVCLLGEDIDKELVQNFMSAPEVKECFPPGWDMDARSCNCSPRISISAAGHPYGDRIVFIGDCGVTRLYKDGIGAAYRTAKAAAATAIFQGISAEDFERHYWPACRKIETDNMIGQIVFFVTRQIQKRRFARRAVLRMTKDEQEMQGSKRRMSMVLWDTFTGSAPYKDIFIRTLSPAFLIRLFGDLAISLTTRQ
jgi:flavin-dependent dehydrogenase